MRSFALEGGVEHEVVESQLDQLSRGRAKNSDAWTARMTVLRELIKHHVQEEEITGFANARREFGSEELEKLGEQFRQEKEKLL